MKVHGELHGHRTKAELAKRTLPVKPPPMVPIITLTFDSEHARDEYLAWLEKLDDETRSECCCL